MHTNEAMSEQYCVSITAGRFSNFTRLRRCPDLAGLCAGGVECYFPPVAVYAMHELQLSLFLSQFLP
jgi:hypothetical protein